MTDHTTTPSLGEQKSKQENGKAAAPSGAAVAVSGLPRLGSVGARVPDHKTKVVDIPDRGVSIVLKAPSIGTVVDIQDRLDKDEVTNRRGLDAAVAMAATMLVDPQMSEDQLRTEVEDWTLPDFEVFSTAVFELAGVKEEVQAAVASDFQGGDVRP